MTIGATACGWAFSPAYDRVVSGRKRCALNECSYLLFVTHALSSQRGVRGGKGKQGGPESPLYISFDRYRPLSSSASVERGSR
jgi:hypothetical protein